MTDEGQKFKFLVQGSAPSPYEVVITAKPRSITASCTCPAGQIGQACKHRLNILSGAAVGVVSKNTEQVKVVAALVQGTPLGDALHNMAIAEIAVENAKSALSASKKAVSGVMNKP